MNLDELISQVQEISSDPVVTQLAEYLGKWKLDDKTAEDLNTSTERFIGNSWIKCAAEHKRVYELWAEFRDQAIKGIGKAVKVEKTGNGGKIADEECCGNGRGEKGNAKKSYGQG